MRERRYELTISLVSGVSGEWSVTTSLSLKRFIERDEAGWLPAIAGIRFPL